MPEGLEKKGGSFVRWYEFLPPPSPGASKELSLGTGWCEKFTVID